MEVYCPKILILYTNDVISLEVGSDKLKMYNTNMAKQWATTNKPTKVIKFDHRNIQLIQK